jgi:3,4-dihydroxy 2-butanone 4-phosphate synthase/GTP cyclohydrolase II
LVLSMGDLTGTDPVLVRMHAVDSIGDIVGGLHLKTLHGAMEQIRDAKRGVVVLIRESKKTAVSDRIRQMTNGVKTGPALRDYGIGAQILNDLGVRDMILLSNHKRNIIGLDGYGLNIVEQRAIDGCVDAESAN